MDQDLRLSINVRRSLPGMLSACLATVLLAAACVRGGGVIAAGTPAPATPTPTEAARPTRPPMIPVPTSQVDALASVDLGPLPIDLAVIDSANVGRLARIRDLAAPGLPAVTSGAALAFLASYEHQLIAHFDNGRTIVWNIASGEVIFEDSYPNDGSRFVENPALAILPSYPDYLATSALTGEPGSARSIVLRPPYEPYEPGGSFRLPAASPWLDDTARVMSLAFSPDGHLLAIGLGGWEGGAVQLWDIWDRDDHRLVREITFDQEVSALQFSSDGSILLCAVDDVLVSLDLTDGSERLRRPFDFLIGGISSRPGGQAVAIWGYDRAVLESPLLAAPLEIPAVREIRRVAFSPDERIAVLADVGQLRFWDLSGGVELASFSSHQPLLDVAMLDNGRLVATIDAVGRVSLWGVRTGSEPAQSLAMISGANAALMERSAALYVPGNFQARLTPRSDLLVVESSEGLYLVDLPSLQLRRFLSWGDGGSRAFDVSANGRWLAWVADEGVVSTWHLQGNTLGREVFGPDEGCCAQVLLDRFGNYLVTVQDFTAKLWFVPTGGQVYAREGVQQVHVSPDGSRLAFEQGLDVSIMDLHTRRDVRQLTGFSSAAPVFTTKFSPTWNAMYWAGRAHMQLVDVDSGELGPEVPFSWGEFSPQGERIAVVEDGWIMETVGQVVMIDVQSGETRAVFDHHEEAIVRAVAFSPDGRLLATALGQTIKIWNALNGEELATLPKAGGSVYDLAFTPDRRMLLSRSEGDLIELWVVPEEALLTAGVISVDTASSVAPVEALQLQETVTDAVFSPDESNIGVSTASGAIWFWDLASGQAIPADSYHTDWVYRLAYNPAGTWLTSVSKDGDLQYTEWPRSYAAHDDEGQGELSALAYLPDGESVATSGQDGILRFWEMPYLASTLSIQAHPAWVWDVAVSPVEDLLATASADRSIKLWAIKVQPIGNQQASLVRTFTGHTATVWGVDFAPDGRTLASASWDGTVRLWDVGSGESLAVLEAHTDWVYDVAYSPDGSLLASSSADGTVRLWDAATGELLATLEGTGGRIWRVDFSPDGRNLVSASDTGEVVLWGAAP